MAQPQGGFWGRKWHSGGGARATVRHHSTQGLQAGCEHHRAKKVTENLSPGPGGHDPECMLYWQRQGSKEANTVGGAQEDSESCEPLL